MLRPSLFVLAASCSLVSLGAYAQNGPIELEGVVVAGEPAGTAEGSTGETAAGPTGDGNGAGEGSRGGTGFPQGTPNSQTITQAEIERNNPQDLQQLFVDEPTVNVGSSIPLSQKLYVQGVEEPNLAVTIDGTRQNNKIFHHSATTLVDPDLLKAVRIDPGVAPADAGPGALGGSIAFETKDVDDLLAPGRMFGGLIGGEYITNGNIFSTNGALYGRYEGFEALAYGKWATGDDREDGNGDTIIGSGTNLLSGVGKVAYESEGGHRIEAAFEIVNDDDPRPYRANIGRLTTRPDQLVRDYHMRRQNYTLTYTHTDPTAWWDPKVQIGYSRTDLAIDEVEQSSDGYSDSLNGRIQNTVSGTYGSIVFGSDFYVDTADTKYVYVPDPAWNEAGTERAQNFGLYTQARLDWTSRFRTSFGGRIDVQHFEGVDGFEDTNVGPSLNITGEYDLTSFLTAYVGASRVFAGIPLAENFIINPAWVYAGPVEPTTSDNVVAGLSANYNGFNAGAKVFQTHIYDARAADYSAGPFETAKLRTRGYELKAGYNKDGIVANVGYAYIDADLNGKTADSYVGRYLTTPLGHIIKASAAYTHAPWGLTVGANTEIAFENDDVYDPFLTAPPDTIPGYEVVNAFAEWTPARFPNLTLRGEVNNIFDEAYVSRATYGQEYTSQGIVPLYEPGRSFTFKATAKF